MIAHFAVRWDRDSYLAIRATVAPFRHGGGRRGWRLWPKHTSSGKGMNKSALIPQTSGCAAEIISYAIILYVKVQSSVTEYRCPFLSLTPPDSKTYPAFLSRQSFASNHRKTNRRHHSFECFYTAIPTSCCKKKKNPLQTFQLCVVTWNWLILNLHFTVFFLLTKCLICGKSQWLLDELFWSHRRGFCILKILQTYRELGNYARCTLITWDSTEAYLPVWLQR